MSERLLPISEVCERVGLKRSTIYKRVAAGTFPRALELGPTCVRWRESEIRAWIDALPLTRAVGQKAEQPPAANRTSANQPMSGR